MNKNREFWPVAKYYDPDGRENQISTSTSCHTFEDAWNQIVDYWKEGYKFDIFSAWIDIYENGKRITNAYIIGKDYKEDN